MTVEADFRATLVAHAPLVAVVPATRISLNAVAEGAGWPAVIYTVAHTREHSLEGDLMTDQCSITVECWSTTATEASAVADLVTEAVRSALLTNGALVTERSTAASAEDGLHAEVLLITWWDFPTG